LIVRIIKNWDWPDIFRQTADSCGIWNDITFTEDPVKKCDYVIICNKINSKVELECNKKNIWAIIQEPPIKEFDYLKKYFSQYNKIFTQDENLTGSKFIQSHPALPWHINKNYNFLKSSKMNEKSAKLSWVTSNSSGFSGHRKRMGFLDFIQTKVEFDLWGKGFKFIEDKWNGINNYMYSLSIENFSCNNYWTEKLSDCFLSWAMPIYYGCKNIYEFFPKESMVVIDINNPEEALEIIKDTISSDKFYKNIDAIAYARELILDKYQFFPYFASLINEDLTKIKPGKAEIIVLKEFKNRENKSLKDFIIAKTKFIIKSILRLISCPILKINLFLLAFFLKFFITDFKEKNKLPKELNYLKKENIEIKKYLTLNNSPLISIIYPLKNNNLKNLIYSVRTILENSNELMEIIVVDYGNNSDYRKTLKTICDNNNFRLISVDSQGLFWNRSHAINIGVKNSDSKYIIIADPDMFFRGNILSECLKQTGPLIKIECDITSLNNRFSQSFKFHFLESNTFKKIGGYNENIFYPELEEKEINQRYKNSSIKINNISDKFIIFQSAQMNYTTTKILRLKSFWNNSMIEYLNSKKGLVETNWNNAGKNVSTQDRPILLNLLRDNSYVIDIENYEKQFDYILNASIQHKYIRLNFTDKKSSRIYGIFKKHLYKINYFFNTTDFDCFQFDYLDVFYLSLNILQQNRLIDYYIYEDYLSIFLLFE
jgi:hypothetical protein